MFDRGCWYNAGLYLGPGGERFEYRKANLATAERGRFAAGAELPVFEVSAGGRSVKVAIQLCRELRYPEQWRYLARRGAEVFVYLTNAVGDESQLPVWRSQLISRASENQRFVLSSNSADSRQKCPTAAVSPAGKVLWEPPPSYVGGRRLELDLAEVSDFYLKQARTDLVDVRPTR